MSAAPELTPDQLHRLAPHVLAMGEALALSASESHQGDTLAALRWLWLRWRSQPSDEEQAIQRVATRVLLDISDDAEVAAWRAWWGSIGAMLVLTTQVARRRLGIQPRARRKITTDQWN